jgi:hypothetical protein
VKFQRILNILALLVALAANGLANALPLNGRTTGEISDSFPVLFTPAGYVFSIWGLIYLLLIAFVVYQALPAQRENRRLDQIGYWFVASCAFNTAWIFLWHYGYFLLTEVAIVGLLVSLAMVYQRLEIGLRPVEGWERWVVNLPFSVYLGWASVATIANTAIVLYDAGWNGWGLPASFWTVAVLLVAAGIGAALISLRQEVAFPLVLVWAFIGIAVKQAATPVVAITAGILAAFLIGWLLFDRLRRDPGLARAASV